MDELASLREFRREATVTPAARADARLALQRACERERRRRQRPPLLLVATGFAALVFAGTAYAVARQFLIGDPAPVAVKSEAARLHEVKGELIPWLRAASPGILASQTRLAASLQASTGLVYLWVAPTDDGRSCLFLQAIGSEQRGGRPNVSGDCNSGEQPVDWRVSGMRIRSSWLVLVSGRVDKEVRRVEVEVAGRAQAVPLQGRFFLSELSPVRDGEVPPVELVAYGRHEEDLVRSREDSRTGIASGVRRWEELSRRIEKWDATPLLKARTQSTNKPIALYVFESDEETCSVLVVASTKGGGCSIRAPRPREIVVNESQIGAAQAGTFVLYGQVGEAIEELELRFEDGRTERLPLARQWTLYRVDARDFADGRRPIALIGRGASGEVIAERKLRASR